MGLTKKDLALYVEGVADLMLPHVADRPLTVVRCPGGFGEHCFYQRHLGKTPAPPGVQGVDVRFGSNPEQTFVVRDAAGLVGLVQLGVLEIHPWGARRNEPERPDRVVFDLDPGPALTFQDVVAAARDVRRRLDDASLSSFVKTTGGKGLHVVVPLSGHDTWDDVHDFARDFAVAMAEELPDLYTANPRKAKRAGRSYIDWGRNARGATSVGVYSMRARESAPVSMPIPWSAIVDDLDPTVFTVPTVPLGLRRRRVDPWEGFFDVQQALPASLRRRA